MENKEIQLANIKVALEGLCESNEMSACRQKEICDYFQDNLAENQTVSVLGSGAYKVVFEVKCDGQPDQVYAFFKKSKIEQQQSFPEVKTSAEILQGLKRSLSDKSSLKLSEITKLTLVFPDQIDIDSQMTIGPKVMGVSLPALEAKVARQHRSEEGSRVHYLADYTYAKIIEELYKKCGYVCSDLDSDNLKCILDEKNNFIEVIVYDFDCFAPMRQLELPPEAITAMGLMNDAAFCSFMQEGIKVLVGGQKVFRCGPNKLDPGYVCIVEKRDLQHVIVGRYPLYFAALKKAMERVSQQHLRMPREKGLFRRPGVRTVPESTRYRSSSKPTEPAFK